MVLGSLFHLVGAYTQKLWLAKVLFFVCGTSSCCVIFSDHSPGLLTDFLKAGLGDNWVLFDADIYGPM